MRKLLLIGVLGALLVVPSVSEAHTLSFGRARAETEAIGHGLVGDPNTPWVRSEVGTCRRPVPNGHRGRHQASCVLYVYTGEGDQCQARVLMRFRGRSRGLLVRPGNVVCQ